VPQPASGRPMSERDRLRALAATHRWVGAVELPLSASQARTADLRAAVTIRADTRVHVLDAYCAHCKRNFEALIGQSCTARDPRTNEHLRGGPIGERKKRGRQPRQHQEKAS
jgi:hypothetical protein